MYKFNEEFIKNFDKEILENAEDFNSKLELMKIKLLLVAPMSLHLTHRSNN